MLTEEKKQILQQGTFIPAHPLALGPDLKIDEAKQRQLTHYYIESGVGGLAVGVHTTQFEIRDPQFNLYETVLRLAAEEVEKVEISRPIIRVAGICGATSQALQEAELALKYDYDLALLSLGGLNDWTDEQLVEHVRAVAARIPVMGFYLQPAVGGRLLSYHFWEQFAQIEGVVGIKVAAFNRYQTLDVVRAVCASPRNEAIALYTGNDDNIVADLLTPYRLQVNGEWKEKRFVGGLLGHWSVWTAPSVQLFQCIKACVANGYEGVERLLALGVQVTDMNAALFDVTNQFKGSIAGIHEVLRRAGLMEGRWCLNPKEVLSPGQLAELDRVMFAYPHLTGKQELGV